MFEGLQNNEKAFPAESNICFRSGLTARDLKTRSPVTSSLRWYLTQKIAGTCQEMPVVANSLTTDPHALF